MEVIEIFDYPCGCRMTFSTYLSESQLVVSPCAKHNGSGAVAFRRVEDAEKALDLDVADSVLYGIDRHPLGNGLNFYKIYASGHTMIVEPWWFICGETGETIACTCGFYSVQSAGRGCPLHNERREHNFDDVHKVLYELIRII